MQPREEKINPKFFAIPFGQFQARAPTPQTGKPATPQAQEAALRKGHASAVPCQHPGELSALTNLIRAGLINGSVVEVGDVVVGVAPVALGGVVGDAQVVKARQEHQDADDQHGDGPVGLLQGHTAWGMTPAGGALLPLTPCLASGKVPLPGMR